MESFESGALDTKLIALLQDFFYAAGLSNIHREAANFRLQSANCCRASDTQVVIGADPESFVPQPLS
jgi:hypothetical protein